MLAMDVTPVSPPSMVIDFRLDGEVEAMHRDGFPLAFLGKQKIIRASDIRFDEASDLWDIHLATSPEVFELFPGAKGFPSYNEARTMEVRWIEMARLHGLAPHSPEGLALLGVLRKRFD